MKYYPVQPPILVRNQSPESLFCYKEYRPCDALRSSVACYWTIHYKPTSEAYLHRIIPDGCVDIIFDLEQYDLSEAAFVAGVMTSFKTIPLSTKNTLFGIRFYLENARRFMGYPVSEFHRDHISLEDIWGHDAHEIVERMRTSDGVISMIEYIESVLIRKLKESAPNPLLQTMMSFIYETGGAATIRELSDQLSYSERNVRRIFIRELGISPKELSGIIRFQNLLQDLYNSGSSNPASIAVQHGYYDQSHLIKSFKRLYGLAPGQVMR